MSNNGCLTAIERRVNNEKCRSIAHRFIGGEMKLLKRRYFPDNDKWLKMIQQIPNYKTDNIIEFNGKASMDKRLMFIYSNNLTRGEAECFALNLMVKDELFLVQVKDNPAADRKSRTESFVVVRFPRPQEVIKGDYQGWFTEEELIAVRRKVAV